MDLVTPFVGTVVDLFKAIFGAARKKLSRRKYDELLSTVITELLRQHPDITLAQAKLAAAEAIGVEPNLEIFRAKEMLEAAKRYGVTKRYRVASKFASKKAMRKAPKKAVKKAKKK